MDNPQLGLYAFDTAVNMGVGTAKSLLKQSGEDLDTFEKLRRNKYQAYADARGDQKQFLKGWNNRVDHVKTYAKKSLPSSKIKPYELGIEMNVDKNGNVINYYSRDDVKNMSTQDVFNSLPTLKDQALYKLGHPTGGASNINNMQIIPSVHFGPQKPSERLKGLNITQLTEEEINELLEELI